MGDAAEVSLEEGESLLNSDESESLLNSDESESLPNADENFLQVALKASI